MTPEGTKRTPAIADVNTGKEPIYRDALNSLFDGVLVTDLSGQVLWVNRTFLHSVSLPPEAVLGKPFAEVAELVAARTQNREELRKQLLEAYNSPDKTATHVFDYRAEKRLFIQQTRRPLYSASGEVAGHIFAYHDVTREKEIDMMKTEFISIASHELRTPMTSIKGSLDLLLGGFAGEVSADTRELLVIAQQGCDRLIRLINDILDIAKIEAGRVQLKFASLDLRESAERSARSIKAYADGYNVGIKVDCPQPLPEVMADRDRMDQIITNLLSNAVKFSPPGGVVTVSLAKRDNFVECAVADEGQGIPPDQLEKVFGKFQQVEGHEGRRGGTGLGLAIVKALVEGHKGRIWLESKLEEGSRFIFQIPVPG